jgi:hypothetical protein
MLLELAVQQLTASIPAGSLYHAARGAACKLHCIGILTLYHMTSLLPLPAAYTGPQLAMQVIPSPLGAAPPQLLSQQQQRPQPQPQQPLPQQPQPQQPPPQQPKLQQPQSSQQQQAEPQWYTVTPSAQLLTELLPLLTSYCLAKVQEHHYTDRPKLMAAAQDQAEGRGWAAATQGSICDVVERLEAMMWCERRECVMQLGVLLSCAIVPDPNLTTAEVQAAASTQRAAATGLPFHYRCVLHAPDAVQQTAVDVMRVCEALLRDAVARCEAAAQLQSSRPGQQQQDHSISHPRVLSLLRKTV